MNELFGKKTCPKCKKEKFLTNFHQNAIKPDGRQIWCAQCQNKYMRSRYAKRKLENRCRYYQAPRKVDDVGVCHHPIHDFGGMPIPAKEKK